MVYCSTDDVKRYSQATYTDLGFTSDSEFVTFLSTLISRAQGMIDRYCGVPDGFFEPGGVTRTAELYDHDGGEILFLDYAPVISVSSLEQRTSGLGMTEVWEALTEGASNDFIIYKAQGKIYFIKAVSAGYQKIKVTYVAGYASTPGDLADVCAQLAANILANMVARGTVGVSIGEVSLSVKDLKESFTFELTKILSPHVKRRVAT